MLVIGEWLFDHASRRLLRGQEERRLSPKAADVLQALAATPHQVWSRDALLERVWPNVMVGEEVLTHAIAELRRGLGDDFRAPSYVETVHKRGYRLRCFVEEPETADDAPPAVIGELDLHGYAAYLEACDLFDRGGTGNTQRAASLFSQLSSSHPGFAPAQVGAAKAIAFLDLFYSPGTADPQQALGHCSAARKSDPRSAEAFAAQGFIRAIGGDYRRGLEDFGVAVRLAPQSSDVHYLAGRACFVELDVALAAPMLERAAMLRADDYQSPMLAGKARQLCGDEVRARSNFAMAATRIAPRLEAFPDDFVARCGLSRCLVYLGRPDEAWSQMSGVHHADPATFHLACTYARVGESRRALDTLEQMVEHGWNRRGWLRDPDFDTLRQDRRFVRIAESLGCD